jgi:hypothetical protein
VVVVKATKKKVEKMFLLVMFVFVATFKFAYAQESAMQVKDVVFIDSNVSPNAAKQMSRDYTEKLRQNISNAQRQRLKRVVDMFRPTKEQREVFGGTPLDYLDYMPLPEVQFATLGTLSKSTHDKIRSALAEYEHNRGDFFCVFMSGEKNAYFIYILFTNANKYIWYGFNFDQ